MSVGLNNTDSDVDDLLSALKDIASRREEFSAKYISLPGGEYCHRQFKPEGLSLFDPAAALDVVLGQSCASEKSGRHTQAQSMPQPAEMF